MFLLILLVLCDFVCPTVPLTLPTMLSVLHFEEPVSVLVYYVIE